jgi:hypothetical protein
VAAGSHQGFKGIVVDQAILQESCEHCSGVRDYQHWGQVRPVELDAY